jgi:hypothetical protein
MPNGPGVPNRNAHFATGAHEDDPPFDLPPEKEAYYEAARVGDEHRERMASMSPAERNNYMKGLREGLGMTGAPKRGDLDNPLKKDQPKEPVASRATGPGSRNPMVTVRQLSKLARKAKGRL